MKSKAKTLEQIKQEMTKAVNGKKQLNKLIASLKKQLKKAEADAIENERLEIALLLHTAIVSGDHETAKKLAAGIEATAKKLALTTAV